MTVDDHDMNVRAREPRVHNDNGEEQRWSELPGLTEGRHESWMADRAKNALGCAKLASIYLDQERGRIGRLRKTKSVLALGNFIGTDANKRRHRPYPKKLNRPRNQGHRKSPRTYGRFLPDGSLPSLTSTKSGDPIGSANVSGLLEVSVPRRSSRNSFAGKGMKNNNFLLHSESVVSSPALYGRERAIVPISLALHMKRRQSRTNPSRGTRRTDSHSPYVPGGLVHHSAQRHLKEELSQNECSSYDAAKDRGHTISSKPSAIDLFYQHELVPEPASRLEEEVSMTQQPNCRFTIDFGREYSASEKPSAVRNFLATTASVTRPPPSPSGASSDLCGVRDHELTPGYHKPRTCNARTRNRVSFSPQSYAFASGSPSFASLGPQYLTSTERWEGDTKMRGNIRRHRRSNSAPIETKAPATSERDEGEWNTVKANPLLFSPTIPKVSNSEAKETPSEQRLVSALVRLENNKYLDALRDEYRYIEALKTLKSISCPPVADSPNTTGENIQRKLDATVQAAGMGKRFLGRSNSATDIFGEETVDNTSDSPYFSAEASEGEVISSPKGVEDLSVDLPRIGSRERETLRLLYREWWMQLARGGSVSCLPEPSESLLGEGSFPVADRQANMVNVGGDERGEGKLGTQELAQVELRGNLVRDSSATRDNIALATEVEFSGSLRDVAGTVSASLKVRQTSGGGARDERHIGSTIETWNSLNVVRRPQVMYDCTGNAPSADPVPSSTNTCDATDDAGHVNYCRKRILSLGSAEDLARNGQNNHGNTRTPAMTLGSAEDLARDDYMRQGEWEKQVVPRFFEDVATVSTSTNTAVEMEAGSPGNLGAIREKLPASAGVHLGSVGVGTPEWPRDNMRARSSSSDASRQTHELVEGTEVTTSMAPLLLATTTYGKGSSDVRRGKEEKQPGTRYSQGATITSSRKDAAIATNVQLPWNIPYSAISSDFHGVHLTSAGKGADEPQSTVARVTGSSAVVQSFPGTGGYVEGNSGIPLSPPTSTCNTTDDAGYISGGQKRESFFSLGSAVGMAQDELSEYPDNQRNHSSNNAKGEKNREHTEPRYSKDATTASTRKDVAVATEIQLQWGPFDASAIPATFRGLQLTSSREGADEMRTCDPRANGSSTTGRRPQGVGENTEASTSATSLSPTSGNCGITDYAVRTCHGRSREKTFPPDSEVGMMQNEHLEYTGNQHNQTSSEDKEEEQASPRYFQDATAAPTQKDGAVATDIQLPWNLSDASDIFSAFFGLQRNLAGLRTGQRLRPGPIAIESSSSVQCPQGSGEVSEASTSVVPMSPPVSTYKATDDADYTSDGRMTIMALSPGSAAIMTRDKPSKKNIKSDQISTGARGGKEEAKTTPRSSEDTATVPTRKGGAGPCDLKLPWSPLDVSSISSPFHRAKPTLVETGTDEKLSCDPRATRNAVSGRRPQGADRDDEVSTSATPVSPSGVRATMDDTGQIYHGRKRVDNFTPGSRAGLVQDDAPEDRNSELNRAVIDTRRGNDEEGQLCPQNTIADPTRKDAVVATDVKLSLSPSNASAIYYAFPGVQLTSAGVGTDETQRNWVRAIESAGYAQCPKDPDGDTGARFSMIPVLPSATTCDATDDASNIGCGQTAVSALSPNSAVVMVRDEPPKNVDNQPGQISNDIRLAEPEKQAGPPSSQDTVTVSVRNNGAGTWDLKLPRSLFDILSTPPSFHRAKLASVGVGTGEILICDPRSMRNLDSTRDPQGVDRNSKDDSSETPLSPLSGACGTTDHAGNTSPSRSKVNVLPFSLATNLMRDEPPEYMGNVLDQVSSDIREGRKIIQAESRCIRDATTAFTQKDDVVATDAQVFCSLSDVSATAFSCSSTEAEQSCDTGATGSSDAAQRLQGTGRKETIPGIPVSPPTSIYHATDDAGHITHGRTMASVFSPGSRAGLAHDEMLEYAGSQPHQISGDTKQGEEKEQMGSQYSQDPTNARQQTDVAVAIEAQLPYSLCGVNRNPSSLREIHLTTVRAKTNKIYSRDSNAIESSDAGRRQQDTDKDSEVTISVPPMSPSICPYTTTDNADKISRYQIRASDCSPGSRVNLEREKYPKNAGNQPNQTSNDARRRKEEEQTPPTGSQSSAIPHMLKNVTIGEGKHFPWNLGDFTGSPFASPKEQEASAEENTEEIRGNGARASRSNFDSNGAPQAANDNVKAKPSVTLKTRPSCMSGATDDFGCIICDRKKASSLSHDWGEDLAPHEPSGYTKNQSTQATIGTRRRNLEEQVVSRCSHDAVIGCTRKDVAESTKTDSPTSFGCSMNQSNQALRNVRRGKKEEQTAQYSQGTTRTRNCFYDAHKAESPESADDIMENSVASPRAQLTSVGACIGKKCHNRVESTRSSSDANWRLQDAVAQHGPSGHVCTPNQTLVYSRRWSEEVQMVSRLSQGASSNPAQRYDTITARAGRSRSLGDTMVDPSTSPGVELSASSLGPRTQERHRSGTRGTRSGLSVSQRPQAGSRNMKAATTVTVAYRSPPITRSTTHDAHDTSYGRTTTGDVHLGQDVDFASHKPSENVSKHLNQSLTDVRGTNQQERGVSNCSQNADTAFERRYFFNTTNTELPGSLGNSMEEGSSPLGVQMTSVETGMDESRRRDTGAIRGNSDDDRRINLPSGVTGATTSVTMVYQSPPIIPRIAGHGSHPTNGGRTGGRVIGFGAASDVVRQELSAYAGKQDNVALSDKRENEEEYGVPRYSQGATITTTRNNNVVHLTSVGVQTDKRRCRRAMAPCSNSDPDGHPHPQASCKVIEAATAVSLVNPIITPGATRDAPRTSQNSTREENIDSESVVDVKPHEPSRYVRNQFDRTPSNARRRKGENQGLSQYCQGTSTTSTRDDVTVTTKAESSGSPAVRMASKEVMTEGRSLSETTPTWSSSDDGGRPHGVYEDRGVATTVTYVLPSPPLTTRGSINDAYSTSRCRTGASAIDSGAVANLAQLKPLGNVDKQPNRGLIFSGRWKEEELSVPQSSQGGTKTSTQKMYSALTTKAESPQTLRDIMCDPSAFTGAELTSAGVEMYRRCRSGARTPLNEANPSEYPQGACKGTDAAIPAAVLYRSPPTTHGATLDAYYSSHGHTKAGAIDSRLASDFGWQECLGYIGKHPSQASNDARRGNEKEHALAPRRFQDADVGQLTSAMIGTNEKGRRAGGTTGENSDAGGKSYAVSRKAETPTTSLTPEHQSQPFAILGTTHDAYHTKRSYKRARIADSNSAAHVAWNNSSIRWKEEKQAAPRCFQSTTTAFTPKYVAATTKVKSPGSLGDTVRGPSSSLGVQLTSVQRGTDGNVLSGTSTGVTWNSLNAGQRSHATSGSNKAGTYVTEVYQSPPAMPCGATHDAHHNSFGHTGARAVSSGSGADIARHEPSGYVGKKPHQYLDEARRGDGEERGVPRYSQGATRTGDAVTTDAECSASLGAQLPSGRVGTEEKHRNRERATRKIPDESQWPQGAGVSTGTDTSATLVYRSQPDVPPKASHDAHQISCGRTGTKAIDSGEGPYVVRHEPLGYADSRPKQALADARRDHGQQQGLRRYSSNAATDPIERCIAVTTQADGNQLNHVPTDSIRWKEEEQTVPGYFQNATTDFARKYVAITTEAGPPGSFHDIIGDPSAPPGVQMTPLEIEAGKLSPSGASVVQNISNDGEHPQVATGAATSVTVVHQSPPIMAPEVSHDAHPTSRGLTGTIAIDSNEEPYVVLQEPSGNADNKPNQVLIDTKRGHGQEQGVRRYSSDAATDSIGRYNIVTTQADGNQLNHTSTDPIRWKGEEEAGPKNFQNATTDFVRKNVAITTESGLPGSFHNIVGNPSTPPWVQMAPLEIGTHKSRLSGPNVMQNISNDAQRPQVTTEAAIFATMVYQSPPIMAPEAPHDADQTSRGRTGARAIDSDETPYLVRHEPLGYAENRPNQFLTDAKRGHGQEHGGRRYTSDAATDPIEWYIAVTTQADGNQLNHASTDSIRWIEEEHVVPRCFQNAPTYFERERVAITNEAGPPGSHHDIVEDPSAPPGVQMVPLGIETDKPRPSGASVAQNISNDGQHPQVTSEAATSVTLVYRSPPIIAPETSHDAHQTNRGLTGTRAIDFGEEPYFVRYEAWGNVNSQPNQVLTDTKRGYEQEQGVRRYSSDAATSPIGRYIAVTTQADGNQLNHAPTDSIQWKEEEEAMPRYFQNATTDFALKDVAITTESEPPGSLHDIIGDPSAPPGVQMAPLMIEPDKPYPSGASAMQNISNDGRRFQVTTEAATSVSVVYEPPPIMAPEVSHDAQQTSGGRRRTRALGSGEGLYIVRHEPLGYVGNRPNQALTGARRDHGQQQGVRRNSSDAATDPIERCIAVTAQADGNQLNHASTDPIRWNEEEQAVPQYFQNTSTDSARKYVALTTKAGSPGSLHGIIGDPPAPPGVQMAPLEIETHKPHFSDVSVDQIISNSGQYPQVTNEAATFASVVYQPPPIMAEVSHDAHQTSPGRTRTRAINSGNGPYVVRHEPLGYAGNRPSQVLTVAKRELGQEQGDRRYSSNAATDSIGRYIAITTQADGNQVNHTSTDPIRWKEEEQAVPRCFQNATKDLARNHFAITTEAGSPGSLYGVIENPSAPPEVHMAVLEIEAHKPRPSGASVVQNISNDGQRPQVASEAATSVMVAYQSSPTLPPEAYHDAHQTSRGRTGTNDIGYGEGLFAVRHESSGNAGNQYNQALIDARRRNEEKPEGVLQSSQFTTTSFKQKSVAITTETASSALLEVQMTSVGVGTAERSARITSDSPDAGGRLQVANSEDTEATTSITSFYLSPPITTHDATHDAHCTKRGHTRAGATNSEQHIYTSTGTRREEEQAQAVSRYPQDVTAAPTRMDVAVATREESLLSPGDLTRTLPASFGVHMTSVGIGTDERRGKCTSATARSSDAGWPPQRAHENTEVETSMTVVSPSITTRDTIHHAHFTIYGRTKARAIGLGSAAGSALEEPLESMYDEPNQPLKDDRGGKTGRHLMPHASPSATTAITQNNFAIATEAQPRESLGDVPANRFISSGVELTSVGVGTDEIPGSGARATGRSSNVGERPQGARGDSEAVASLTPMLPPSSTWDAKVEPEDTSRGRKRVRTITVNSKTEYANHVPSGYTDHYPPNQASIDIRRRNKENQVVLIPSQRATEVSTRKDIAVGTATQGNPHDVSKRSSAFFEEQLTSGGLQTNERHRSGARALMNSSDGGRRPHMSRSIAGTSMQNNVAVETGPEPWVPSASPQAQLASVRGLTDGRRHIRIGLATSEDPVPSPIISHSTTHSARRINRGRTRARATDLGSVTDKVRDCYTISDDRSRARSLGPDFRTALEREKLPEHRSDQANQASTDTRKWKGETPAISRLCQGVFTAFKRKDNPVSTGTESPGDLDDVTLSVAAPLTTLNAPSVVEQKQELPTRGPTLSLVQQDHTNHGRRKRARAMDFDSEADLALGETSGYTRDQRSQALLDSRKCSEEKQVITRLSQDVTAEPAQNDDTVEAETEPGRSLGNITGSHCASPGIRLTLVGIGTDKRCCSDIKIADAAAPVHPLIIPHDVHHTIQGQTRRGNFSLAEAADLARNGYISHDGRTRASALSLDSPPGLARGEFLAHPGDWPSQTSTGAKLLKEEEHMVPRLVLNLPTSPTRKDFAVMKETESPKGVENTIWSLSTSPGVQLTPDGEGKDDKHRSIRGLATSATLTSSPIITRGTTHAHQTINSLMRARAITRDSAVGAFSGFPGVQLTSVGQGMEENRRSGTGVATSATLIASPITSHGAIYDARHPIVGPTRTTPCRHALTADVVRDDHTRHVLHTPARPLSLDSAARSLPAEHLLYIGNQPKQALTDAKRWKGGEQQGDEPRSFQNVNITFTKSNAVSKANKEAQGSFGGAVVYPSPSGVQLTSVRIGTDEKRQSGASHDTHDNIWRRSGASARCRGLGVRLAHNEPFGGYMRSHLNQVLGDTKPDKEEKDAISRCPLHANTASAQRGVGAGTELQSPGRLGNDHGIISVLSRKNLVSLGVGTGERRSSRARVTWSLDAGRRHQDAGEGVGTTTSVTVVSPPILTRDATHHVHPTIRGKTRASDRRHDSIADLERHAPRGYTCTVIQRNKDLNDTRPRNSEHMVPRYSRDVATVCTHKEPTVAMGAESLGFQGNARRTISGLIDVQLTSPGGTTDERRADGTRDRCTKTNRYKLDADAGVGTRIAISANPKLSPISTHSTKYDASHTINSRNRPKTRAFVPGSATGFTEGESWGFAGDQSLSGARGWNGRMEKGRGAVKGDLDADFVSKDDDLIPEMKEEEGHHGRIYLPDGRFVGTLGVNPDSKSGDDGKFPADGGVKSDHGKDDESLEYDMDDFEEYT